MTIARPEDYADLDDGLVRPQGQVTIADPSLAMLTRIAVAVEQIALELANRPQGSGLAQLPPVRPQVMTAPLPVSQPIPQPAQATGWASTAPRSCRTAPGASSPRELPTRRLPAVPSSVTESALFAAYRHAGGYLAPCACGVDIFSESVDEASVTAAIDAHNDSAPHLQWREWQAAVKALQRPTRHPCPCHGDPE
jgi:hypothetical protein